MTSPMFLIAIAGPSGSGKSTIASALQKAISDKHSTAVVSLDRYYLDLRHLPIDARHRQNFDTPTAIECQLLLNHIDRLSAGTAVDLPRYSFATHLRLSQVDVLAPPAVLVVEGLFALYWPELRDRAKLRVYVDAPPDACLQRRTARDSRERGRSESSIVHQFYSHVEPMWRKHISPTRTMADLTVSGIDPLPAVVDTICSQFSALWSS